MKTVWLLTFLSLTSTSAWGFNSSGFYGGLGYFSQYALNATSQKEDGSGSLLGEPSYPILLKFDHNFSLEWFVSPQLIYGILPRKSAGDTAKVTTIQLAFPIGKNFATSSSSRIDWFVGPGLLKYQIDGAGGTTVMSNGTGTATFAVPGRSSTVQKVIAIAGVSISFDRSRLSAEIIFENLFSNKKRAEDLMVSYAYRFGGGL